jgi:hypothetical protein
MVGAQVQLDSFLGNGPGSLIDAIQARTTGSEDMNVMSVSEYGLYTVESELGEQTYLSAVLGVNVLV